MVYHAGILLSAFVFDSFDLESSDSNQRQQFTAYSSKLGWLMLLFTPILSGMTILILHQESSTTHFSQNVLLVVALYTFINLGNVLRGFAKPRRATVLLNTDKNVVMVTMMTSLYNLQTLMLAAYSHDKSYTQLMTMTTGLVIIVITIGLALWMIIESRHKIKQLE